MARINVHKQSGNAQMPVSHGLVGSMNYHQNQSSPTPTISSTSSTSPRTPPSTPIAQPEPSAPRPTPLLENPRGAPTATRELPDFVSPLALLSPSYIFNMHTIITADRLEDKNYWFRIQYDPTSVTVPLLQAWGLVRNRQCPCELIYKLTPDTGEFRGTTVSGCKDIHYILSSSQFDTMKVHWMDDVVPMSTIQGLAKSSVPHKALYGLLEEEMAVAQAMTESAETPTTEELASFVWLEIE